MPFGGYKQSGIGREHGRAALDAYLETKSVCIAVRLRPDGHETDISDDTANDNLPARKQRTAPDCIRWSHPLIIEQRPPRIIVKGDGAHVTDIDGKTYVDGVGGLWNVNVGHNRPEVKAAICCPDGRDQLLLQLRWHGDAPVHRTFRREDHRDDGRMRIWRGCLFSANGSDAVETALKLSAGSTGSWMGEPGAHRLHLAQAGLSWGSVSAALRSTARRIYRSAYGPLLARVLSGRQPLDLPQPLFGRPRGTDRGDHHADRAADPASRRADDRGLYCGAGSGGRRHYRSSLMLLAPSA